MRLFIVLLAFISSSSLFASPAPVEKVLWVRIDEYGIITVGRDTIGSDELATYIQERLFKSYMGTGQMHDKIKFEKLDKDVSDMVVEVILREIKEGQRKALSELCVQKYRRSFQDLDKRKQDKLKKQFPVLFQEAFIQTV